jgi:hypothetical protein
MIVMKTGTFDHKSRSIFIHWLWRGPGSLAWCPYIAFLRGNGVDLQLIDQLARSYAFTLASSSSDAESKSPTAKESWPCDPSAIMEGMQGMNLLARALPVPEGLNGRCRYRCNLSFANRYRYYYG